MESTSCSLPRLHSFGEDYHSFVHFPQSIVGEMFNSTKFLKVIHTLFEGPPTRIYMSSNLFRPLCNDFLLFAKTT